MGCSVVGTNIPAFVGISSEGPFGCVATSATPAHLAIAMRQEMERWECGERSARVISGFWRQRVAPINVCQRLLTLMQDENGSSDLDGACAETASDNIDYKDNLIVYHSMFRSLRGLIRQMIIVPRYLVACRRARVLQHQRGLRLHLGCGDDRLADFVNVDTRSTRATDAVMDLNLPRFAPGSVAFAFSNAFFEHLYRDQRLSHLQHICTALAEDGAICYIGMPYFRNVAPLPRTGAGNRWPDIRSVQCLPLYPRRPREGTRLVDRSATQESFRRGRTRITLAGRRLWLILDVLLRIPG